jgi:6,7-dimethyl-8-ribityllumazine synthase
MTKVYEGKLIGTGFKVGIVVSRWNSFVTTKLLEGALDALKRHEVDLNDVEVAWVPGTWEAPLAAQEFARSKRFDAIVCLGAILKGDTPHAEYLASQVSKGLAQISLETGVPIAWGVLTCDTIEQAVERSGVKMGNKGAEAATSAIETVHVLKQIRDGGRT